MRDKARRNERCLCYTTDINYALPTLLSAVQARANLASHTDVIILLIGSSSSDTEFFAEACSMEGIVFTDIPHHAIDSLSIDYARYFLDDLIDGDYNFVTHVDGDTQVLDSLNPLLDFEVTPGRVLAVPDPIALTVEAADRAGRKQRKRLTGIGLRPEFFQNYVNTGLFQVRRCDLNSVSRECRTLALREGPRMIFGQQDAFNVALGPSIDLASLRWNYPAFFSNFGFQDLIQPRVRHFMSDPRPWQGPFPPWGSAGHAPYIDLLHRHPALARLSSPLRGRKRIRYEIQQRMKRLIEPFYWNTQQVRRRIIEHEASSVI